MTRWRSDREMPARLSSRKSSLHVGPPALEASDGRRKPIPVAPERVRCLEQLPGRVAEMAEHDDVAVSLDPVSGRTDVQQLVRQRLGRWDVRVELREHRLALSGGRVDHGDRRRTIERAGDVGQRCGAGLSEVDRREPARGSPGPG